MDAEFLKKRQKEIGKPGQGALQGVNLNSSAIGDQARATDAIQKKDEEMRMKQMWSDIASNLNTLVSGKKTMPTGETSITQGFNVHNPGQFGRDTPVPMPFDQGLQTQLNLDAVIRYTGPETYKSTEEVRNILSGQLSEVQQAITEGDTIYQNVSPNFFKNRLYIMASRRRQNDLYGF